MQRSWVAFLLLAVSTTAALETGNRLFLHLTYLLLTMILLSFIWTLVSLEWVRVTRETKSTRAQVGHMAEERFTVRNTGFLPKLWLELRDHSTLPGHRASRVVHSLPPRGQYSWEIGTPCQQRGEFRLGPVVLSSGDPLGLFKIQRPLLSESSIIVYPAMLELSGIALSSGQLSGGEVMRQHTHHVTTNVTGIRGYLPGDSLRRIHWLSTARLGRMIVKEFELDSRTNIWLFLDMEEEAQAGEAAPDNSSTWKPSTFPWTIQNLDPTTEEYGVVIASSLARHFIAQGMAVGLVSYGQRQEIIQKDRGPRQLMRILEALATLKAKGDVPLAEIIAAEALRLGPNTAVVAITPSQGQRWAKALQGLTQRGVQAQAVLLDARSFEGEKDASERIDIPFLREFPIYLVKRGEPIDQALNQRRWERI